MDPKHCNKHKGDSDILASTKENTQGILNRCFNFVENKQTINLV